MRKRTEPGTAAPVVRGLRTWSKETLSPAGLRSAGWPADRGTSIADEMATASRGTRKGSLFAVRTLRFGQNVTLDKRRGCVRRAPGWVAKSWSLCTRQVRRGVVNAQVRVALIATRGPRQGSLASAKGRSAPPSERERIWIGARSEHRDLQKVQLAIVGFSGTH